MQRKILGKEELRHAVDGLGGWKVDGNMLKKRVEFENFSSALEYVNAVGSVAETADHHPDITFGWGYAEIALTTHDRGGVTDVDIALAKKIDEL